MASGLQETHGAAPASWASQRFANLNGTLCVLVGGLAVMFVPTLCRLLDGGAWTEPESSHGPLILAIALWLLWDRWRAIPAHIRLIPAPIAAWSCLVVASLIYVPGRALNLAYLETGSFVWAMTGMVLFMGGFGLVKRLAFPLFFMLFMIPLPMFISSHVSGILKPAVSMATVYLLSLFDYPMARSGAIISIGPYQLLVADACSGMSSLFMLETLGILYLNLVRHGSVLRNIVLPILIVPISFISNVARVIALVLITYYFGDEAGQGFMHGFAGITLFVAGSWLMFATDTCLRLLSRQR